MNQAEVCCIAFALIEIIPVKAVICCKGCKAFCNLTKERSHLRGSGGSRLVRRVACKHSRRRNKPTATKFFARMSEINGLPMKIVSDKNGTNTAGIKAINKMLKGFGCPIPIEMVRRKYLNNIVEQDHRFIKRRTRPMRGFKAFTSAAATLDGIEVSHMFRKGQLTLGLCLFQQFAELAA